VEVVVGVVSVLVFVSVAVGVRFPDSSDTAPDIAFRRQHREIRLVVRGAPPPRRDLGRPRCVATCVVATGTDTTREDIARKTTPWT